jgi:pimeloyl-ACP methyl ester carboxylesterase
MTEAFSTADGRRLAYERVGRGPVLVCHPGGPGLSSRYLTDLGGLGERFTLVMLDPRGTGGSSRPPDPSAYRLDDYVADVEELREHLGEERLLLLGFSHGAIVALAYAAAFLDRVERLVVACGSARFHEDQVEAMHAVVAARSGEPWFAAATAALELEAAGAASEDELRQAMEDMLPLYFHRWDGDARRYAARVADDRPNADAIGLWEREIFSTFDLRPQLSTIVAPTLVVTGADDFITGPAAADEVAGHIAGARLVIIPDCGHFLWVEQRQTFVDLVVDFLGG